MKYDEALEWLYNVRRFGPKRTLKPTRYLLGLLGNPHHSFHSILIAGTNGKGSTSAITASILQAQEVKVGLFTSPHLIDFKERITVDGIKITEDEVASLLTQIRSYFEEMLNYSESMPLRFFDIVTAMAFQHFKEHQVEIAVLEVGLGGRLDATNTVKPFVSVITNIGYEHTNILGETLREIAGEKAGIMRKNGILVTATQNEVVLNVFKEKAKNLNSKLIHVGRDTRYRKTSSSLKEQIFSFNGLYNELNDLVIPLLGDHQIINAATAITAVESLKEKGVSVSPKSIRKGLESVLWPGRLEIICRDPLIVLDCAKDAEATEAVKDSILKDFEYNQIIAVVSISSDKKIPGMIKHISSIANHFILTIHSVSDRAADLEYLASEVEKNGLTWDIIPDREKAFNHATKLAEKDDLILVIGSVYHAGDARKFWLESK